MLAHTQLPFSFSLQHVETAVIKVTVLRGRQLKVVQTFGWQDPYVTVTALPWGDKAQCKPHHNGGKNPVWDPAKHDATMVMPWHVERPETSRAHTVIARFQSRRGVS